MINEWRDRAACKNAGHPVQFDPPARTVLTAEMRAEVDTTISRFCDRCPVKKDCLQLAVDEGYTGIWGGILVTDEQQRQFRLKVRRDQRRTREAVSA